MRLNYKHSQETKDKIRQGQLKRGLSRIVKCEVCGIEKRIPKCQPNRRFCSTKCRAKVMMPEHPVWQKGHIPWTKGKTKETNQAIRKMSEDRTGIKNWLWNGGSSRVYKDGYHSREYKKWRDEVFKRDDYTCQKYKIKGGRLRPHHIENFSNHPESRFIISNGVTLSEKAHKEFHKIYGNRNNNEEQIMEFLK